MAESLDRVMKALPATRREKIERRGAVLITEQMILRGLRKT